MDKIIAAAHQLKNSGISIFREQSLLFRKKRQTLIQFRSKLLEINPNVKIIVKGDKMQINSYTFVYKYSRGLNVKNSAELTFIKQMFGDRSSEFFDCSEGVKLAPTSNSPSLFPSSSQPIRAPPVSQHSQVVRGGSQ